MRFLIKLLILFGLLVPAFVMAQTILPGSRGGTGYATTTGGNVGNCLAVLTNSPITFNFTGCSGGGGGSAYPFGGAGNSTSTLTQFNGGLTSYASTTIGNGTATGGLTVNGTATTTTLCLTGDTCRTTWPSSTGSAFPFTPFLNYNGTTTPLGLQNGFFSAASSTINSALYLTNLAQGLLFNGTNGITSSIATTTGTCSGNVSCGTATLIGSTPVIFNATTSPTVGYLTATTTATSTFVGGINLTGTDCFATQGTCLQTFIQNATAYKQAVNYATAAVLPGTPSYNNGSSGVGATLTEIGLGALTVDGQTVSAGQRILVKTQADQTQNGIYVVTNAGSAIANYILTRSTDYNTSLDIYAGTTIPVLAGGTVNGDTQWTESTTGTITVGASNIVFLETSFGTNGTVTSVAQTVPSFLSISGSPITGAGTLAITYSGTALPIANGGTNATSFTTSGNGIYWNGTSLFTAPATSPVTYPFASSTGETATTGWIGTLNLTNALTEANGGTGASTIGLNMLLANNGSGVVVSTSSPTAAVYFATSTTQASILPYASSTVISATGNLYANSKKVDGFEYPSFSFPNPATTTWTGTTTVQLGVATVAETWASAVCISDAGTLNAQFYSGTNKMNMFNASTTGGTVTTNVNNTFAAGTTRKVDFGTPASSPTYINCTIKKSFDP